jgi:hypothetical protein
MAKRNTIVGLDVHKQTIDVVMAEPARKERCVSSEPSAGTSVRSIGW